MADILHPSPLYPCILPYGFTTSLTNKAESVSLVLSSEFSYITQANGTLGYVIHGKAWKKCLYASIFSLISLE